MVRPPIHANACSPGRGMRNVRAASSQPVTAPLARHAPTSRSVDARVSRPPPTPQVAGCITSEFLCRARVMEEDVVDFEGSELASSVAIDGVCDMLDESAQPSVVVLADHRARGLSLRLAGHESRLLTSPTRAWSGRVRMRPGALRHRWAPVPTACADGPASTGSTRTAGLRQSSNEGFSRSPGRLSDSN